jgi:hypothetical protein
MTRTQNRICILIMCNGAFQSFILCIFMFFIPCCDVRYDFRIQTMLGCRNLQLFVWGLMSYLCYLCLFTYSDVQHILCCIFVRCSLYCLPYVASFSGLSNCIVYPMLPVSLDCLIVLFLPYSLTFVLSISNEFRPLPQKLVVRA